MSLLCRIFGHKMILNKPRDISSGSKCKRCPKVIDPIEWPRYTNYIPAVHASSFSMLGVINCDCELCRQERKSHR